MNHLKLVSGKNRKKTLIRVGNIEIGRDFIVIAGPCSVESEEQVIRIAEAVKSAGADILRGGAFKPRTSPYSFQGLGLKGLKILSKARDITGMPVITEVLDTRDVDWVTEYADILQIGARNMQNFSLLKEIGKADKPVMLKRGMYSTYAEWLNCAEYIMDAGNPNIILCERGIRTFETYTRNTLDLSAVPAMKSVSHLPVIIDPTHGTGRVDMIAPMSLASVAVGADGLMVEVHHDPKNAKSDKDQALLPQQFEDLMNMIRKLQLTLKEPEFDNLHRFVPWKEMKKDEKEMEQKNGRGGIIEISGGMIDGTVSAPPSKSMMQRAVAAAVLSDKGIRIENFMECSDSRAALKIAESLGSKIKVDGNSVFVSPGHPNDKIDLFAGESGLSLRMFSAIVSRFDVPVIINAGGSLLKRPVGMIKESLASLGVSCWTNDGFPPVEIKGPLKGGEAIVDCNITSQFLTGLIIALQGCREKSRLKIVDLQSRPYAEMTIDMVKNLGGSVEVDKNFEVITIRGGSHFTADKFLIEGDWSGAASLLVAGAINGRVAVEGLKKDSRQADKAILDAFNLAGIEYRWEEEKLIVESGPIKPFLFDVRNCPDLLPVLTSLAAYADGKSEFTGIRRLKYKESDRCHVISREFSKLGIRIEVEEDKMSVYGGNPAGGKVNSCGDHRIAMALTLVSLRAAGSVRIKDPECVSKSYPGFYEDLKDLGLKIKNLNITGEG